MIKHLCHFYWDPSIPTVRLAGRNSICCIWVADTIHESILFSNYQLSHWERSVTQWVHLLKISYVLNCAGMGNFVLLCKTIWKCWGIFWPIDVRQLWNPGKWILEDNCTQKVSIKKPYLISMVCFLLPEWLFSWFNPI